MDVEGIIADLNGKDQRTASVMPVSRKKKRIRRNQVAPDPDTPSDGTTPCTNQGPVTDAVDHMDLPSRTTRQPNRDSEPSAVAAAWMEPAGGVEDTHQQARDDGMQFDAVDENVGEIQDYVGELGAEDSSSPGSVSGGGVHPRVASGADSRQAGFAARSAAEEPSAGARLPKDPTTLDQIYDRALKRLGSSRPSSQHQLQPRSQQPLLTSIAAACTIQPSRDSLAALVTALRGLEHQAWASVSKAPTLSQEDLGQSIGLSTTCLEHLLFPVVSLAESILSGHTLQQSSASGANGSSGFGAEAISGVSGFGAGVGSDALRPRTVPWGSVTFEKLMGALEAACEHVYGGELTTTVQEPSLLLTQLIRWQSRQVAVAGVFKGWTAFQVPSLCSIISMPVLAPATILRLLMLMPDPPGAVVPSLCSIISMIGIMFFHNGALEDKPALQRKLDSLNKLMDTLLGDLPSATKRLASQLGQLGLPPRAEAGVVPECYKLYPCFVDELLTSGAESRERLTIGAESNGEETLAELLSRGAVKVEGGEGQGPRREFFALIGASICGRSDVAGRADGLTSGANESGGTGGADVVNRAEFARGANMAGAAEVASGGGGADNSKRVQGIGTTINGREVDASLFSYSRSAGVYWFNTRLEQSKELEEAYKLAGWLMGHGLLCRAPLGIQLPPVLFQAILEGDDFAPDVATLQRLDPSAANSISQVASLTPQEMRGMLIMDGLDPSWTAEQYTDHAVCQLLHSSVEWQAHALASGFLLAADRQHLDLWGLGPDELVLAIAGGEGGTGGGSVPELRKLFRVVMDKELSQGDMLWQVLESWPDERRRAFLQFVTGVSRMPLPGSELLKVEAPFVALGVTEHKNHLGMLPQSHTCDNLLELPNYWESLLQTRGYRSLKDVPAAKLSALEGECRAILDDRLTLAVTVGLQGYGLDERDSVDYSAAGASGAVAVTRPAVTAAATAVGAAAAAHPKGWQGYDLGEQDSVGDCAVSANGAVAEAHAALATSSAVTSCVGGGNDTEGFEQPCRPLTAELSGLSAAPSVSEQRMRKASEGGSKSMAYLPPIGKAVAEGEEQRYVPRPPRLSKAESMQVPSHTKLAKGDEQHYVPRPPRLSRAMSMQVPSPTTLRAMRRQGTSTKERRHGASPLPPLRGSDDSNSNLGTQRRGTDDSGDSHILALHDTEPTTSSRCSGGGSRARRTLVEFRQQRDQQSMSDDVLVLGNRAMPEQAFQQQPSDEDGVLVLDAQVEGDDVLVLDKRTTPEWDFQQHPLDEDARRTLAEPRQQRDQQGMGDDVLVLDKRATPKQAFQNQPGDEDGVLVLEPQPKDKDSILVLDDQPHDQNSTLVLDATQSPNPSYPSRSSRRAREEAMQFPSPPHPSHWPVRASEDAWVITAPPDSPLPGPTPSPTSCSQQWTARTSLRDSDLVVIGGASSFGARDSGVGDHVGGGGDHRSKHLSCDWYVRSSRAEDEDVEEEEGFNSIQIVDSFDLIDSVDMADIGHMLSEMEYT
eukprot:gene21591-28590_t